MLNIRLAHSIRVVIKIKTGSCRSDLCMNTFTTLSTRLSFVLCIFIKGGTEAFTTEAKSMLYGRHTLRLFIKIAISKNYFIV